MTEVALSRALTFLYTGVVELDEKTEALDEIIKISQLLNLPELAMLSENARKGEKRFLNRIIRPNVNVAKHQFLNKVVTFVCFSLSEVSVSIYVCSIIGMF